MIEDIQTIEEKTPTSLKINGQILSVPAAGEKVSKPTGRKLPKKPLIIIGCVLLFLLLLFGGIGFYAYQTYRSFLPEKVIFTEKGNQLKDAIKAQDLVKTKQINGELRTELSRLSEKFSKYSYLNSLPIAKNYYADVNHFIKAGESGTKTVDLLVDAIIPYADLLGLGGVNTDDPKGKTTLDRITFVVTTLDKIRPQLDEVGKELDIVRTELDQVDPNRYPVEYQGIKIRENLALAIDTLDQGSMLLNNARPLLEVMPDLLGINSTKYYFVLFQNDAELRPTGGFMTAYGILKVDKGKISPVFSDDMYSLDASYTKRIAPPEPIKKYLKDIGGATMTKWYLRDMNFSPDFAVSMKQFSEIYNNQIPGARKVDGIIAVDTELLANLLKIIGSVGVPEYGNFSAEIDKRCDCPQVVYRLEEIADKPVPGVKVARKAVIGPLMHSVLANAMNSPKAKIAQLVNVGLSAIQEKHLILYLYDEKAQSAVEAFNMAGKVRDFDGDYTMLIDTNLGGAKSDLFIDRGIEQLIEVADDGTVTKTVNITYNNPYKGSNCNLEKGDLCLNGLYRNYFRLYVPKGSELIESKGSEVDIETLEDLGKTVFAGFFGDKAPLRPQSKTKVSFNYRLPFKITAGQEYKQLIQKQAGVDKYSYTIDFKGDFQEFELRTDKELKW